MVEMVLRGGESSDAMSADMRRDFAAEYRAALGRVMNAVGIDQLLAAVAFDQCVEVVDGDPVPGEHRSGRGVVALDVVGASARLVRPGEARVVAALHDGRDRRPDDRGGSRRADTGEDEVQVADKDLDRHGCIGFFTTKAAAVPQPEVDVDEVAGRLDIPGVEVEQMM